MEWGKKCRGADFENGRCLYIDFFGNTKLGVVG